MHRLLFVTPTAGTLLLSSRAPLPCYSHGLSHHRTRFSSVSSTAFTRSSCHPQILRTRMVFGLGAKTGEAVSEGQEAPNFTLIDQNGKQVTLSSFKGKRNVVLVFFPRSNTSGCTAQLCNFRDNYEAFTALEAEILGISGDSNQKSFADKYNYTFSLLSDKGNVIRKLYGVPSTLGLLPGRVTYVIGKDGIVKKVYNSQLDVKSHVDVAKAALEKL